MMEIANQLISADSRTGRLLDIGCGTYPYFLINTRFQERFGVDKVMGRKQAGSLCLSKFDLEHDSALPFDDGYFNVVTMLAVIEHVEPNRVVSILRECHRVLKMGGTFIITTPAWWTDKLLRGMAMLRLVSPEEILEHKDGYNRSKITSLLQGCGFDYDKIIFGYFELFMNMWVTATK